jgi:predicted permease
MNLSIFYTKLGAIVLIILLGFFLGRRKWVNGDMNAKLVNLLLSVFMPAALFSAFPKSFNEASLAGFLLGVYGGIIVLLIIILISRAIFNKKLMPGEFRFSAQFAFIFNNATFLGYPLISSTFGEAGLVPYCGFIIVFNIALFSYGVWLFKRKLSRQLFLSIVTNPNIIAVILGTILFLFSIQIPSVISEPISLISGATTPLSLICIGYMLSNANLKTLIKRKKLFVTAGLQLILAPLLTYIALTMLNFPPLERTILVVLQALPTATSLGLFARKYGNDDIESSELVAISTLLSVITLPIIVLFV